MTEWILTDLFWRIEWVP